MLQICAPWQQICGPSLWQLPFLAAYLSLKEAAAVYCRYPFGCLDSSFSGALAESTFYLSLGADTLLEWANDWSELAKR